MYDIKGRSIGDLTSLDIIFPSSDDGSLEPKRYNVDFSWAWGKERCLT